MARVSDRQLWNWIMLAGVVSFFLGKKALEGAPDELAAWRQANGKAA